MIFEDDIVNRAMSALKGTEVNEAKEVPIELLAAQNLDLSRWSLLLKDSVLMLIPSDEEKKHHQYRQINHQPIQKLQQHVQNVISLPKQNQPQQNNQNFHSSVYSHIQSIRNIKSMKDLKTLKDLKENKPNPETTENISNDKNLNDKNFTSLVNHNELHHLISLNLSGARFISDFGVSSVLTKHKFIKSINLSGCIKLTDNSLRQIGNYCHNLEELNISDCHLIEGGGFTEISVNCSNLQNINLSKCTSIQANGLVNIFSHCHKLKYLNLTSVSSITDLEIKILCQNCEMLSEIILKDCHLVSDEGLRLLSEFCLHLATIDISRSLMTFRITDVGLIGFGKNLKSSLKVLKLNGCDHITDVGMQWLTEEGDISLMELEISGCFKITDVGLRCLGKECHQLKSIDLTGLKSLSDIGLRSLSNGCPNLSKINLTGLFLLSDQKFLTFNTLESKSKNIKLKGIKDKTNQRELVGLGALRKNSPLITDLNLSGCFRLNTSIGLQVSYLQNLKILNLSGCLEVCTDSIVTIATHCKKLLEFNLTDCVQGVNSKSLSAISKNCLSMRNLILSRCTGVKLGSIQAISTLKNLQRLDLSSCININDDMLMPLCEETSIPLLRAISLSKIKNITDGSVTWLANKNHRIECLALKGTSVSHVSLKALRDRFPYSDYSDTDSFYGFLPKYRSSDKKYMNEYTSILNGFVALQARWRGYCARRVAKSLSLIRKKNRCANKIQNNIRRHIAIKKLHVLRLEKYNLHKAAETVTSIIRMIHAIHKANGIRQHNQFILETKSATKIQCRYRVYRDWNIRKKAISKASIIKERRLKACIKIQSQIRKFIAKQMEKKVRLVAQGRRYIQKKKALHIQRIYRGFSARLFVKRKRQQIVDENRHIYCMATKIQKAHHSYCLRKEIGRRVSVTKTRLNSSIKIQCAIRSYKARKELSRLQEEAWKKLCHESAIIIQCCWRKYAAKQYRLLLQKQYEEWIILCNLSCLKMQMCFRRYAAKKVLLQLQAEEVERLRILMEYEIECAIKIQTLYRGVLGRRTFQALIREKKGRWKELWDETTNKRFFYNQHTGEIRHRIPQDLLDLIPPSTCDNCKYYHAKMECSSCDELFCMNCFEQVHFGGRRKDHDFRCIYDFYDKRIDYGDGSFPCKWPTEIIQDEIQGWMLRVAPIRAPVLVTGDWEQYLDANSHAFYFNRTTFETSYDIPHELTQEFQQTYQQTTPYPLDENSHLEYFRTGSHHAPNEFQTDPSFQSSVNSDPQDSMSISTISDLSRHLLTEK